MHGYFITPLFIKITLDVDTLYRRKKGKHNLLILLDANYTLHPGAWPHSWLVKQSNLRQSRIINTLDINMDNLRTTRDESSPDLN